MFKKGVTSLNLRTTPNGMCPWSRDLNTPISLHYGMSMPFDRTLT